MLITRTSPISGATHTREVPCTPEQLAAWECGVLIQIAMPDVAAPLREYIKSGITPSEWLAMFGKPPRLQRQRRRPS